MKATELKKYITRFEFTARGGGVEIDLTDLGYEHELLSAYQNYLGGGVLGSISNDCTVSHWTDDVILCELAELLRKYFADTTEQIYSEVQTLPNRAY
jgi:hypothetical protein